MIKILISVDIQRKFCFTSDTEILTDLINNALELTGSDRIISVEVNNPDISGEPRNRWIFGLGSIFSTTPKREEKKT